MTQALIIGAGHAGKDLHLPCLRAMYLQQPGLLNPLVGFVDPKPVTQPMSEALTCVVFQSLEEVIGFPPSTTVVHVCVPPSEHLRVIQAVSRHGYRRVIVEKPVVTSFAELEVLRRLQRLQGLEIVVVANWISSALTACLRNAVAGGAYGPLLSLRVVQNKPRFSRTLTSCSHTSALEVELPHQVALALHLAGCRAQVVHAELRDLAAGDRVVPEMGGAELTLRHASGCYSHLDSDLTAPIRKRSTELYFADRTLIGHYPVSADDSYARLDLCERGGRLIESSVFEDNPLARCLLEYYQYFAGSGPRPASDLHFNAAVMRVLATARALAKPVSPPPLQCLAIGANL